MFLNSGGIKACCQTAKNDSISSSSLECSHSEPSTTRALSSASCHTSTFVLSSTGAHRCPILPLAVMSVNKNDEPLFSFPAPGEFS